MNVLAKNIHKLICPYCKNNFTIIKTINKEYGVAKCSCSFYPFVKNIIYIKKDIFSKQAIKYIENNKPLKAYNVLLHLRKLHRYPLFIIAAMSKIFSSIGFKQILKFLSIFYNTYDWFWYLLNRDNIPSYYISKLSYKFPKKSNYDSADLGCGVGHTLSKNTYGLDISFLNLALSKFMKNSTKNILICCDLEKGIPFKTNSLQSITLTDTFHYIKNKKRFLKETKRVLNINGVLSIFHTLNVKRKGNILGLKPNYLKLLLKRTGFKYSYIFSSEYVWKKIIKDKTKINLQEDDPNITNSYAYNFFACSKPFSKKNISLPNINLKRIKYLHDRELESFKNLNKIVNRFNNFIFISPHYDDAILSCALLIEIIKKNKKNVLVVTVFTKASAKPYKKEALDWVIKSGYSNAIKLFQDRKNEDINALKVFDLKHLHLKFTDSAFRKNNYFDNLKYKNKIIKEISSIKMDSNTLLLFPLGIGEHYDHVLLNKVSKKIMRPVIYWEDFPYNTDANSTLKFFNFNSKIQKAFSINSTNDSKKKKSIKKYTSQVKALFGKDKIPNLPESYYYSKDSKILTKLLAE